MIDEYIQAVMTKKQIPGLSVAVVRSCPETTSDFSHLKQGKLWEQRKQGERRNTEFNNGQVLREGEPLLMKGYGIANLEHFVAATEKTVYEIASVGKTFTATVVMMLVEEGLIELDKAIANYLDNLPPTWHSATVRHILSHQSGIPNYTDAENYWNITRLDLSKLEILALVKNLPLKFQPGEYVSYDNTGYYLLGMMLEQITNKSYGNLMQERLFKPLGMNSTRMNNPQEIVPNRASGYRLPNNRLINKPYYSPSVTYSAGGQLSSIEDMVKYEQELYHPTLLQQSSLDLMWTPNFPLHNDSWQQQGYVAGLGWWVINYNNRQVVSHNGSILGFASNITRFRSCPETSSDFSHLKQGKLWEQRKQGERRNTEFNNGQVLIDDRLTVIVLCNLDKIARPDVIAKDIAGYYCSDIASLPIQPAIS